MGYLFESRRHRLVLPHRLLEALVPLLAELLRLLDAVGVHLEDDRWREAATKIQVALEELRRPSELYQRVLRIEQRQSEEATRQSLEQHLAELARATVNADAMKKDREQRKRERDELEATRQRLEARRRRLDREVGRRQDRRAKLPPRKGVAFIRAIADRCKR
jgi:hypothetical protein